MIENELRPLSRLGGTPTPKGNIFSDYTAPLFIAWQLNAECNLECLHCCEEAGHQMPNELTHDEIMDFCQQIVRAQIPYVAISGGEPLLHPDFFTLSEFLRRNKVSIKVETNGTFIDHEVARRFGQLGFRSVQVSVDGATPQSFEKLRRKGNWQRTIDACKYLVAAGVNTEIVFVPTKFNIHETGDVIDLAYRLGIYGFYTGKTMQIGRAAQNWDILCPSDTEYEQFFKVLSQKQAQYDGKMKVYYYPDDVIEELKYRLEYPSTSLLVIPDGKVKLIGPLPFICGDLRKHRLAEIWERYQKAWQLTHVRAFTQKVINDSRLLAESNRWQELSIN
ncbi:MAG: radical SAM protein [Planctomycetes bacterium]|nr:radical SAM protein [Planctomycetota bacterium]